MHLHVVHDMKQRSMQFMYVTPEEYIHLLAAPTGGLLQKIKNKMPQVIQLELNSTCALHKSRLWPCGPVPLTPPGDDS